MEKTFTNIIDELEDFSNKHYSINEFGWGEPTQISATKNHKYPLLWLNPVPGTVEGKIVEQNFEMLILTSMDQDLDKSQLKQNMTKCQMIGMDVIRQYWQSSDYMFVSEGITFTPYLKAFDGYLCGWIFDITVEIENRLNTCTVPKRD